MRPAAIFSAAMVLGATLVAAWTKEDHEIFRLKAEIEYNEGENVTFYSFLGTSPAATVDDLTKAYRKTSRHLHPDKFQPSLPPTPPGSSPRKLTRSAIALQKKHAEERYSRLRLVYNILKGPERERYDHFLKNGFPRWKGTGYYYARFRPGLGSVLVGLFLFVGGWAHWVYLWLNARQQRKFFEGFLREARVSAWGNAGVPGLAEVNKKEVAAVAAAAVASPDGDVQQEGPRNRKERRFQKKASRKDTSAEANDDNDSGTSTPAPQIIGSAGAGRRKVVAGNGKVLIVNSTGEVFLVEENEDGEEVESPLDINEIQGPSWKDTAVVRLPMWVVDKTVGRFLWKKAEDVSEYEEVVEGKQQEEVVVGRLGRRGRRLWRSRGCR
ncbi:hypothetical protein L211DRAFT_861750 [Terfezia boudieri ATCC MYA-4762]|uniref:J domain-containing protein n=1 Tax=Terfezia boudieri ATCC MYA-4762 TaxID=1051890 RepID=A0A3N4LPQ0_9PEZI|nr:hypothetical protein L211DRAFT_861750 [Terfezia boudieri ATCC MYA-4762]